MQETKDNKQVLKEELNSLIGKYIPNKIDLENLTNYLYKLVVVTFKDTDMREEFKKINGISEIDRQGFLRSLHTVALSASSNVMYKSLIDTFNTIKNQVDLVQAIPQPQVRSAEQYAPRPQIQRNSGLYPMRSVDPNEGSFDIDLSDVGKTSDSAREALAKAVEESREADLIQQETYIQQYRESQNRQRSQKWQSSDQDFDISNDDLSKFNMGGIPQSSDDNEEGKDLTGDVSDLTSTMNGKPKFGGISLDY